MIICVNHVQGSTQSASCVCLLNRQVQHDRGEVEIVPKQMHKGRVVKQILEQQQKGGKSTLKAGDGDFRDDSEVEAGGTAGKWRRGLWWELKSVGELVVYEEAAVLPWAVVEYGFSKQKK